LLNVPSRGVHSTLSPIITLETMQLPSYKVKLNEKARFGGQLSCFGGQLSSFWGSTIVFRGQKVGFGGQLSSFRGSTIVFRGSTFVFRGSTFVFSGVNFRVFRGKKCQLLTPQRGQFMPVFTPPQASFDLAVRCVFRVLDIAYEMLWYVKIKVTPHP